MVDGVGVGNFVGDKSVKRAFHHYEFGNRDSGFRIQDSGFEIKDSGFGIRDSGFGIRDSGCAGFGIRDSGFGVGNLVVGGELVEEAFQHH